MTARDARPAAAGSPRPGDPGTDERPTDETRAPEPRTEKPLVETSLALPGGRRGKVRDVYPLPPGPGSPDPRLLLVATDRLSAFDVVLPTPIPGKGRLLTRMSVWWLRFIESRGLARTHLISDRSEDLPEPIFAAPGSTPRSRLTGRVMIGRRCRVVPVECIVRGYLDGSGWAEYRRAGSICGVPIPPGLRQGDRLPDPIFTPSTKADPPDHDEPITFDRVRALVGPALADRLRDTSLAIYRAAAAHALERGIIIADTKFEFGLPDAGPAPADDLLLVDEALTPDSSRFWPADRHRPGGPQESFDKQFVRDYLQGLCDRGSWNKSPPGPPLPAEVVEATLSRYREAVSRLTGPG